MKLDYKKTVAVSIVGILVTLAFPVVLLYLAEGWQEASMGGDFDTVSTFAVNSTITGVAGGGNGTLVTDGEVYYTFSDEDLWYYSNIQYNYWKHFHSSSNYNFVNLSSLTTFDISFGGSGHTTIFADPTYPSQSVNVYYNSVYMFLEWDPVQTQADGVSWLYLRLNSPAPGTFDLFFYSRYTSHSSSAYSSYNKINDQPFYEGDHVYMIPFDYSSWININGIDNYNHDYIMLTLDPAGYGTSGDNFLLGDCLEWDVQLRTPGETVSEFISDPSLINASSTSSTTTNSGGFINFSLPFLMSIVLFMVLALNMVIAVFSTDVIDIIRVGGGKR